MEDASIVDTSAAERTLAQVDEIKDWCLHTLKQLEKGFVRLASLLAVVRQHKYYLVRGFNSEEEYIAATFPKSRAQYFNYLKIGRDLCPYYPRELLEDVGMSKCLELIKVRNRDGLITEDWWQLAKDDSRDEFKVRVSNYLTGKEETPEAEVHYVTFKLYDDQILVVNKAFDNMSKITGSEKSKTGEHLCLMCADFNGGYEENGVGRVMGKNGFILMSLGMLVSQIDYNEKDIADRLVGTIAAGIERGRANTKERENNPITE